MGELNGGVEVNSVPNGVREEQAGRSEAWRLFFRLKAEKCTRCVFKTVVLEESTVATM